MEGMHLIPIPKLYEKLNTLDAINGFIAQHSNGSDLSKICIFEPENGITTPLNMLIIYKIIANDIEGADIKDIIGKFTQNIQYLTRVSTEFPSYYDLPSAYAYSLYKDHKGSCLKVLEYLFECRAELNPSVETDQGDLPLLFEAINLAAKGEIGLWNVVSYYITRGEFKQTAEINGIKFNLLQYLAYQCRLQNKKDKEFLYNIADVLIKKTGLDPEAKIEYLNEKGEQELANFFEIAGNGWKAEDFGLKPFPFSNLRYPITTKNAFDKEINTNNTVRKIALLSKLMLWEKNVKENEFYKDKHYIVTIGNITLFLDVGNIMNKDYSNVFTKDDTICDYANDITKILQDFYNNPVGYNDLDTLVKSIMNLENDEIIFGVISNLEYSGFIPDGLKMLKYDPQGVFPHIANINLLFANKDKLEAIYNNENGLKDIIAKLPDSVRKIVIFKLGLNSDNLKIQEPSVEIKEPLRIVKKTEKINPPTKQIFWSRELKIGLSAGFSAGIILSIGSIMLGLANASEKPINFGVVDGLSNISPELASVFRNVAVQAITLMLLASTAAIIAGLITSAVVKEQGVI